MAEKLAVSHQIVSQVRNPDTDYVTVILDLWKGDRDDPAVGVSRFLALFNISSVPDEFKFNHQYYGYRLSDPESAILWEHLGDVKKEDKGARDHQQNDDFMLDENEERWRPPEVVKRKLLYQQFIAAIDVLAVDYENEEAWAAVDAWRGYHATLHEK